MAFDLLVAADDGILAGHCGNSGIWNGSQQEGRPLRYPHGDAKVFGELLSGRASYLSSPTIRTEMPLPPMGYTALRL